MEPGGIFKDAPNPTELVNDVISGVPELSTLFWLLFFIIAFFTVLHAGIFAYHWYAYNISPSKFLKLTNVVYFAGVLILLSTLFLSTISITATL